MRFLADRRLIAVLRIGLGVLFLAAALPKLQDPVGFARSISNYRMVPEIVERVMALALPAVELIVGTCLLVGIVDAGASLVALVLMIVFTGAVGTAVGRDLDITCGCFNTKGGMKAGFDKILENIGLTIAAFWVWRHDRSWLSLRALLGWGRRSAQ